MIDIMLRKAGHFTLCGIAVILSKSSKDPIDTTLIPKMLHAMEHRGPDGEGIFLADEVAMGIRRLAIVGGNRGDQPIFNQRQTVVLVCNGEIYNHQALRRMLERDGCVFSSQSDVEVILHLYEKHGKACVSYLQGIFAFAIWDIEKKSLFVARDHVGVKPLYYLDTGTHLMFASEMRALLAIQQTPVEFDARAFSAYHAFRFVPGHHTVVHGVQKLRPGQFMHVARSVVTTGYYWRPEGLQTKEKMKPQASVRVLRDLLQSAVRAQVAPDVPSGVLLSGGLDSSALLAMHVSVNGRAPDTYTVCFAPPKSDVPEAEYSELKYAANVAAAFGAKHISGCYSAAEALEALPTIIDALDEPIADPTAIPLWFATKLAHEHGCKVVFSGEGLDELFNGYEAYRQTNWIRSLQHVPRGVLRVAQHVVTRLRLPGQGVLNRTLTPLWSWYQGIGGVFTGPERAKLLQPDVVQRLASHQPQMDVEELTRIVRDGTALQQMTWFDVFAWLPENTLAKSDKISMSNSVELRVPFLDKKIVAYALSFEDKLKLRGKVGKWAVKQAFADVLPAHVRERPKAGFAVPLTAWMFNEWRDVAMSTLLDAQAHTRMFYRPEEVERLFHAPVTQRRRAARLLWTMMTYEIWCQKALKNVSPSNYRFAERILVRQTRSDVMKSEPVSAGVKYSR